MIFEPKKIKSANVSTFPSSVFHEVVGLDALNIEDLFVNSFLNIEFKLVFSSPLLITRLFSTSSLSAIIIVSAACLRLLIFLLAVLIPACDSYSLAFHMMYSA